jgi:hypothetical protein
MCQRCYFFYLLRFVMRVQPRCDSFVPLSAFVDADVIHQHGLRKD